MHKMTGLGMYFFIICGNKEIILFDGKTTEFYILRSSDKPIDVICSQKWDSLTFSGADISHEVCLWTTPIVQTAQNGKAYFNYFRNRNTLILQEGLLFLWWIKWLYKVEKYKLQ